MTATLVERPRRAAPLESRRSRRRRPKAGSFTVALIALFGLCLALYPSTASWLAQYNHSKLIEGYSSTISEAEPQERANELALARQYNDRLLGSSALLGSNHRVPTSDVVTADGPFADYNQILRADSAGLMARLKVPSIDLDLPVYHGTSDETLLAGVGHLEGTALPVGGVGMHSVLTAHRGLASATMFDDLDQLAVGDEIAVEVFGEVLSYRVRDSRVVDPEDTETLIPEAGADLLTLVTCTPLGVNSHRILVTAERVTPTPQPVLDDAGAQPELPFPWWAVALGIGLAAVATYLLLAARRPVSDAPRRIQTGAPDARRQ